MHRRRLVVPVLVLAAFVGAGLIAAAAPATAAPAAPAVPAPPVSGDISAAVRAACAARGGTQPCRLASSTSTDLGHGIVEYDYVLRVGTGSYDQIGLHRVTAGTAGPHAVFMVPGDIWGFDAAFAGRTGAAQRVPNAAAELAAAGIDVWGLDMRWVLVPASVPAADTRFALSWGFATGLADMRLGTAVERAARVSAGLGTGQTALLGWSRGGELAYAYAAMETQLAPADRNVSAMIPVDIPAVYAPSDDVYRQNNCQDYHAERRALAAGRYVREYGDLARFGADALATPGARSADYPDYTHRQVALSVGGYGGFFTPWYHFLAETLDWNGFYAATRYTPERRWFGLLTRVAPYEPTPMFADGAAILCGTVGATFLDHLGEVAVPLFYVAAAGGFGTTGSYSTTLVASTDVSSLIVRLRPVGDELDDYGHVDLWQGTNASRLVWQPIVAWLSAH